MKFLLTIFFLVNLVIHSDEQNSDNTYVFSESDSISGQIQTAKLLNLYMNDKQYQKAIELFSVREQKNIKQIQEDKEAFKYWCLAWTLSPEKYERYISKIKNKKAYFIFENGAWKIDEK
jgi:hypothetical protein